MSLNPLVPQNPQTLNIALPTTATNHVNVKRTLQAGEIIGMNMIFDSNAPITVNFVGTAFGLAGLQQYQALSPGPHTLQLAVVTKTSVGAYTDPVHFTISETVDAPVVSIS